MRSSTAPLHSRDGAGPVLRGAAVVLGGLLVLRFAAVWSNAFAGTALPVPGSISFTLLFTAFSLLHAISTLGWRRALSFFVVCAGVSWCFEAVGIATGLVYGPYHYGDRLGAKLGAVPLIIPLAWFMMVYASWVVARLLLQGVGEPASRPAMAARVVVAAMAMTAWDTVMDPGMARAGAWTWEQGGAYFGVPEHNFAGWLATTLSVYAAAELICRRLGQGGSAGCKACMVGCRRCFTRSWRSIVFCCPVFPSCASSPRSAWGSLPCWPSCGWR